MWGTVSSKEQLEDNKNSLITIIATGLNDSSDTNKTSSTNLPMKNTYNTVKASDINNLLAKSEKKENGEEGIDGYVSLSRSKTFFIFRQTA